MLLNPVKPHTYSISFY